MKKAMLFSAILMLVCAGYSETREEFLESTGGMTDVRSIREVPEDIQRTLISVMVVEEGDSDPAINLNGEIVGKLSSDYIKLGDAIYNIEDVFFGKDSKGNAVLVLWTPQVLCFMFDTIEPALARIGVTMLIQVLYLQQGKSLKIFVK